MLLCGLVVWYPYEFGDVDVGNQTWFLLMWCLIEEVNGLNFLYWCWKLLSCFGSNLRVMLLGDMAEEGNVSQWKVWCSWVVVVSWSLGLTFVNSNIRLVLQEFNAFKTLNLKAAPQFLGVHSLLPKSRSVTQDACERFIRSFQPSCDILTLSILSLSSIVYRLTKEYSLKPCFISYKEIMANDGFGTSTPRWWCKQGPFNKQGWTQRMHTCFVMVFKDHSDVICLICFVMVFKDLSGVVSL